MCLCNPLLLPELQYFTAFVSAIDSAVNPTPHPWKGFRILIPLPSPVHLNLNAFRKQDFMHDLPPPSLLPSLLASPSPSLFLPHFLAYYLPIPPQKNLCGDGFSSCGLRECAVHNSSHGAGKTGRELSPPSLACLPDSPALGSFMCLTLFFGRGL